MASFVFRPSLASYPEGILRSDEVSGSSENVQTKRVRRQKSLDLLPALIELTSTVLISA